ncbi:MAG: hypothetical protein KZQ93_07355 [Candidatus Thiodiazotropha sp. (ex Monitilora ramsayi)]|nr:hypothetical protein [Candidatus Thiodiazotropha sp. (ex Monitilora ramsayi)]
MASGLDKEQVRQTTIEFYSIGRSGSWKLDVNERVAEVFGCMLEEAKRCTKALNWVPRPPGGKAKIAWLVKNISKSAVRSMGMGWHTPVFRWSFETGIGNSD